MGEEIKTFLGDDNPVVDPMYLGSPPKAKPKPIDPNMMPGSLSHQELVDKIEKYLINSLESGFQISRQYINSKWSKETALNIWRIFQNHGQQL